MILYFNRGRSEPKPGTLLLAVVAPNLHFVLSLIQVLSRTQFIHRKLVNIVIEQFFKLVNVTLLVGPNYSHLIFTFGLGFNVEQRLLIASLQSFQVRQLPRVFTLTLRLSQLFRVYFFMLRSVVKVARFFNLLRLGRSQNQLFLQPDSFLVRTVWALV